MKLHGWQSKDDKSELKSDRLPFLMKLVSDYVIENTFEVPVWPSFFNEADSGIPAVDKRTEEQVTLVYPGSDARGVMHLLKFLSGKPPMFPEMLGLSCFRDPTQNNLEAFIALRGSTISLQDCLRTEMCGVPLDGWNWTTKLNCIFGIAAAMCVLHGENWVHRCISPMAVLLDNNFEPNLGGTGLVCMTEVGRIQSRRYGFFLYTAPELLSDQKSECDKACDVYSFGMVLYSFFTDNFRLADPSSTPVPRRANQVSEFVSKLEDGTRYMRVSGVPEVLWQMITECWDIPERRPSFREIVHRLHEKRDEYLNDEELEADADAVIQYQARVLDLISKYL